MLRRIVWIRMNCENGFKGLGEVGSRISPRLVRACCIPTPYSLADPFRTAMVSAADPSIQRQTALSIAHRRKAD